MSLYKRGDKYTMCFSYLGQRINRGTGETSLKEAQRVVENAKADIRAQVLRPQRCQLSLKEAAEKVYEERWRYNSAGEGYLNQIVLIADMLHNPSLDSISTSEVRQVCQKLRARGLSESTVNRYQAALRTLFRYIKMEYSYLEVPKFELKKEPKGRLRVYSREEEQAILDWFKTKKPEAEALVVILFDTGLRLSEALGINSRLKGKLITSFDLTQGTITSYINKGKTVRTVPLTQRVSSLLQDRGEGWQPGIQRDDLENWWRSMRKALNLSSDSVLHAIRHTCASRLVQAEVPLSVVQMWLGHTSIVTTQRYAHISPTQLQSAKACLEAITQK